MRCTCGVYPNGILGLSVILVEGICASYAARDVMLGMDVSRKGFNYEGGMDVSRSGNKG